MNAIANGYAWGLLCFAIMASQSWAQQRHFPTGPEIPIAVPAAPAVIDVARGRAIEIVPIGYKDCSQPASASLSTYQFGDLPVLGTTVAGQAVLFGGLSGLFFEGFAPNGNYKFISHTDRGPVGEPIGGRRPFLLPGFAPELFRFQLNPTTGALSVTERIQLRNSDGTPVTGRSNASISGGKTSYNDEVAIDLFGNKLSPDLLGADLEGIAINPRDQSFWMVDEYWPAIYHFDAAGKLIDRIVPVGTVAAFNAGRPPAQQLPAGHFGAEALPPVLALRRLNRGFEAVAFQDGRVYAFVQSPLRNPPGLSNAALGAMRNIRIVEFDPATSQTRQFVYVMDNSAISGENNSRADKIGDAAAMGNGQFVLLERDDDAIDSDPAAAIEKKIYRFSLAGATDISGLTGTIGDTGKTVDELTAAELDANHIHPVAKYLHVDLNQVGYNMVEKIEGLAVVSPHQIAVLNDNDFGVAGITIDFDAGTFTPGPNAEPIVLGLIRLRPVSMRPTATMHKYCSAPRFRHVSARRHCWIEGTRSSLPYHANRARPGRL